MNNAPKIKIQILELCLFVILKLDTLVTTAVFAPLESFLTDRIMNEYEKDHHVK